MDAYHIRVINVERQDVAAYMLNPDRLGRYGLRLRADLAGKTRLFWMLHDLEHVLNGESDEPTWEDYDHPYPHFERRADIVAMTGLLHARIRALDAEVIEAAIWREFHIDAISWPHRAPEIARALADMNGAGSAED